MVMNAAGIVELTGLTYRKLNYMQEQIDVLKREKTQGKAREYSFRDLVFLKIASEMRQDNIRLNTINKAITLLDQNWNNTENIYIAGRLMVFDNHPLWSLTTDLWFTGDGYNQPLDSLRRIPGHYYNVTNIAGELSTDQMRIIFEHNPMAVNNEP